MNLFARFLNWLFPFPVDEYFARFIKPHYERGIEAGISVDELEHMLKLAFDNGNPITGTPPGAMFRDMVDKRISEHPRPERPITRRPSAKKASERMSETSKQAEYQWKYGRRNIITEGWMYPVDNHPQLAVLDDNTIAKLFDAHVADKGADISIDLPTLITLMNAGFVKTAKHWVREWWGFELNDVGHAMMWDCFGRYYIWIHTPEAIIEDATGNCWQHWTGHEQQTSTPANETGGKDE